MDMDLDDFHWIAEWSEHLAHMDLVFDLSSLIAIPKYFSLTMEDWISLNMTPGIGPRAAANLLERFGSPRAVFNSSRRELESLRLNSESVESILRDEFRESAKKEIERCENLKIELITLDDPEYPTPLREIPDPPLVLYAKGDWRACVRLPMIGIVGSRVATVYGSNVSEMLGRDLGSHGVCVVSGMAKGIDTSAHRGALKGGGRTLAVIGTGIDLCYPKENARLMSEIFSGGGSILSQFPLGTPPLKDNFPYRNRIISGLSFGVVLVEATERSGSLITGRLAMEQDRDVMAVPGNITSRNSFGTNYLIKCGAKLVQQWQDVVAELPSEIAKSILPDPAGRREQSTPPKTPPELSDIEKIVWKALCVDSEKHIDQISDETGLEISEVSATLFELEIKGLVKVFAGMRYSLSLTPDRSP